MISIREKQDGTDNNAESWFRQNQWLLALLAAIASLFGLVMPLVQTHGAIFDPTTWGFEEAFKRTPFGAEMLFGGNGAINWPMLLLYVSIFAGTALILIGHFLKKEKNFLMMTLIVFLVCGVLLLVSAPFYGYVNAQATIEEVTKQTSGFMDDYNSNYYWYISHYIETCDSRLGVGAIWSAACVFISAFFCFSASISEEEISVREMTEIGILTATAIVLDVIFHYVPNIPGQVGSISVALLPLYIIALRHGPAKAFLASSLVYGLITCATDSYGFFLYPLDYFVGFAGVSILGLFRPLIISKEQQGYNAKGAIFIFIGVMLASIVRFLGSGTSSIVNYGYTFLAALIANSYIFISAAICAVILIVAYGPLCKLNSLFPVKK